MSQADPDGLLDGLDGDLRAERAELVEWLIQQGFSVEEIRSSLSPMLLPTRRLLGDDGQYVSAREISERVGLPIEELTRFQRAVGMAHVEDPEAPVFTRPDGDTAVHLRRFLDLGINPDRMLSAVRVLALGLANAVEELQIAGLDAVLHPGATELETARGTAALVGRALPLLGPMIEDLLLLQLRHNMETEAVDASERAAGSPLPGARMVTVSFADLVGFTALGEELGPAQVEELANRLGDVAHEVAQPPVRLVKTIGDAVMLVCPDTAELLGAMLRLLDAAAEGQLPMLRVGVACGAAVSRAGDWFGRPVNLASRITAIARPGSVLATEAVREEVAEAGLEDRFAWSDVGGRRLKGVRNPVPLVRVRAAGSPDP